MRFFSKKPTEKTIGNLKKDLKDLFQAEISLWDLVKSDITRNTIPTLLNAMNVVIREIIEVLSDVEGRKKDQFHTISYNPTTLSQELRNDLEQLESHLKNQLNQLQKIEGMSQEQVEEILNHAKDENSDISKTSQIIRTLISNCDKEIEQLSDPSNYIYKHEPFDFLATGLNTAKNNPENYILDMKEILKARIEDPKLFEVWFDSGYGILYKGGGSSKFKVVKNIKDPNINKLLSLKGNYDGKFLEEKNYDSIKIDNMDVFELDAKNMILQRNLKEKDFLNHPFWRCIFDDDIELMKNYFNAYSTYTKNKKGLSVRIPTLDYDTTCQWRHLYVNNGSDNSKLNAYGSLSNNGSFLSRMPKQ